MEEGYCAFVILYDRKMPGISYPYIQVKTGFFEDKIILKGKLVVMIMLSIDYRERKGLFYSIMVEFL